MTPTIAGTEPMTLDGVYEQAMRLSHVERERLMERLAEALNADESPEAIQASWEVEIDRRLDEVEKHPELLLDGEAVFAEFDAMFAARPKP